MARERPLRRDRRLARPLEGLRRLGDGPGDDRPFHTTVEDLDAYYEHVVQAYKNFYQRCGVDILVVQSDTGMMGGKVAHEFMVLADGGEVTLVVCPQCGYSANRDVAVSDKAAGIAAEELYRELGAGEVLFDDRELSPGVKFKDADLLGMPVRITISTRSLANGGAEIRIRRTGETLVVPLAEAAATAQRMLQ